MGCEHFQYDTAGRSTKLHSHCCKSCALKQSKKRSFGAPAPDTQTGVTRRHRPSKFCGEDRMHRKASVCSRQSHSVTTWRKPRRRWTEKKYSRQSHSPIEWAIGHSNTENPHNEPCGQASVAFGSSFRFKLPVAEHTCCRGECW